MQCKLGRKRRYHAASLPFIYMMILPTFVFDLFMEIYHRVCFPLYGLKCIDRSKYIKMDRQKLQYLNILDKINCMYCGYVNGMLHYAVDIGAATEKYWCGIKHNDDKNFKSPKYHEDFLSYNNEEEFNKYIKENKK